MDDPVTLSDLVSRVNRLHPGGDALARLSEAVTMSETLGDRADQLVGHFVEAARNGGATWSDIGRIMGVSRQAVQKRFLFRSPVADLTNDARFTPRARAVMAASQEEARAAGHNYLGTEHIVLGLLSQPEGLAAKFLSERTTPERLRAAIGAALGPRIEDEPQQISYTPRGKRSVELSTQEAQRLGHDYVGTEHLLLGVLTEHYGVGAQVLRDLGVEQSGVEGWLAAR
jgi:hypothetical protein